MASKGKQARVLCFSSYKGGVGKTCSACNVGAGLARLGKRCLLIDLDPQAHLSTSLGVKGDVGGRDIYRVLVGQHEAKDVVLDIGENLSLIPASLDLAGAEIELSSEAGRDMILDEVLQPLKKKYDYILIDCSPSLGLLSNNALTAADEVVIPLQAQYLAVQGLDTLKRIIDKIQRRLNEKLRLGGIIITQYDQRKAFNRDIADVIGKHFGSRVFRTKIRDNVALAEAPSSHKDIFRYDSKSHGAKDYAALCNEIVERHQEEKLWCWN